jgi:FkbM family methyltransferase
MKIKKTIKKCISGLIPQGHFKEYIKCNWYNLLSNKNVHYSFTMKDNSLIYHTKFDKFTFNTNKSLYSITPDFENYQHYYKVKNDDVVVDGGANIGCLTLLFSKIVGKQGHIYAFEPDVHNISMLHDNFKLNDHSNNFSLHNELLWSENSQVDFQETGTVASSAKWFNGSENVVKKKAITLDAWSRENNINQLDFIKMDIEGAELEAIEGCVQVIEKFKPHFAIASYHIVNDEPTYIKLERFFKKIGYPCVTKKFSGYEIITFAGPNVLKELKSQ